MSMLEMLSDVKQMLERISYKPTWHFEVTGRSEWKTTALDTSCEVDDVATGKKIRIFTSHQLHLPMEEAYFLQVVNRSIRDLEEHEMDEWLKLDGICLFEPHSREKHPIMRKNDGKKAKKPKFVQ